MSGVHEWSGTPDIGKMKRENYYNFLKEEDRIFKDVIDNQDKYINNNGQQQRF
jgi:hypothetical protein